MTSVGKNLNFNQVRGCVMLPSLFFSHYALLIAYICRQLCNERYPNCMQRGGVSWITSPVAIYLRLLDNDDVITLRACARGKVIGLYVCRCRRQHEYRQISRSRHNESVDICEKLVSARFELLNMAHKHYKSCIFGSACLWFTDHTHSALCAFCSCAQLQLR